MYLCMRGAKVANGFLMMASADSPACVIMHHEQQAGGSHLLARR